jgi:hypothetical protein
MSEPKVTERVVRQVTLNYPENWRPFVLFVDDKGKLVSHSDLRNYHPDELNKAFASLIQFSQPEIPIAAE